MATNPYYQHTPNVPTSMERYTIAELRSEFDKVQAGFDTVSVGSGGGVTSVNLRSGAVTLTASDVGLGSVNNTSDVAKPVSTAQAAADAAVQSAAATDATTKANAAQAAAIAASAPASHVGSGGTSHANVVAAGAAGFMTGADKTKLDGIATGATANTGTVTSVAALTLGTTGLDLSSSVATGTTTPVITLNVPTASATARGALSAADWSTFNGKQPAGAYLLANQTITFSGGATGSGSTAVTLTLSNTAVMGQALTGFVSGAGTVSALDTILSAIQKLDGNVAGKQAAGTYVNTVNGNSGTVTAAQIAAAATAGYGFTPYSNANPAGYISSVNWASPGAIGSTTPSTGAFTTVTATGGTVTAATISATPTTGGSASITSGNAGHSGYIQFSSDTGVRQGYIGFSTTNTAGDTGTIPYVAGLHAFTGALAVSGALSATSSGGTIFSYSNSVNAAARNFAIGQLTAYGTLDTKISTTLGGDPALGTTITAVSASGLSVTGTLSATGSSGNTISNISSATQAAIRLGSTFVTGTGGNNKDWSIVQSHTAYGDLVFRIGNAEGADPRTSGTTIVALTSTGLAVTGTVTGSNLSGTNTGDQTSVSGASGNSWALAQSDGTSRLTPSSSIGTSGSRTVSLAPNTYNYGLFSEFKSSSLFGFTGNYSGLLTYASFIGTTGSGGDPSYQLAFHPSAANALINPSIKFRAGIDITWGAWYNLLHDGNFVAGTNYVAPTGSIAACTGLTGTQVTTALGYTPGSAAGRSSFVISTNTTATAGGVYTATAALTLTLPLSPVAGNTVELVNMSGVTSCVIGRNGQNIMGLAEDMTIDQLYVGVELMFTDATRGWVMI